jgi:hypothetical protein
LEAEFNSMFSNRGKQSLVLDQGGAEVRLGVGWNRRVFFSLFSYRRDRVKFSSVEGGTQLTVSWKNLLRLGVYS